MDIEYQERKYLVRKPDAIGIGFRRCSSSWLNQCLSEHPDIGKPQGGLHYFSTHLDKGDDWYLQQFAPFSGKPVLLELAVSYSYPENIQKFVDNMPALLPNAKIFAVVRNPVERAFSDYRMALFQEELPADTTFEQALEIIPAVLERGQYEKLLQQVLAVIPEERIKILFYDDVSSQPNKLWRELCLFIGASPSFIPSLLYTRVNHLAAPKHSNLHKILRRVNRTITNLPGVGVQWQKFKRTGAWRKILSANMKKGQKIKPETRQKLIDYYASDIEFLNDFTNRDLSGWQQ